MKKLLVVLLDRKILLSVKSLLSHNNYEVIIANNPQDAIRLIYNHLPDLIISDLNFSDEELDLHRSIREKLNLKSTPILFFIGNEKQDLELKLSDRYIDFISKPYQSNEIIKKVSSMLNSKKETVSLKKEVSTVSIDDSVFLEVQDYSTDLNDSFSDYERIDALARKKIESNRLNEKEAKLKLYNKLFQLRESNYQENRNKSLQSYSTNEIKKLIGEISQKEGIDGGISMLITEIELKIDKDIFEIVLKEAIENAVRHSSSNSPVEIIGIIKDSKYVIALTNYSILEKEINLSKVNTYGLDIIDLGCQMLNILYQVTVESNNYVKSRFTININNN